MAGSFHALLTRWAGDTLVLAELNLYELTVLALKNTVLLRLRTLTSCAVALAFSAKRDIRDIDACVGGDVLCVGGHVLRVGRYV